MEIELQNYNLESTLLGGQTFNWDKNDQNEYIGFFKEGIIVLSQKAIGQRLEARGTFTFSPNSLLEYLNLDTEYADKLLKISQKDQHISKAVKMHNGLRILAQDPIQTILSFILTSHKNIKAVRKVIRDLSRKYGEKISFEDQEYFTFPSLENLKEASENDLRNIGLGFRAPYFKDAVYRLSLDKITLKDFKNSEELKLYLLDFKGIGEKIADCIAVFGFKFYDITPLDIWAKRVITDLYKVEVKNNYKEMSKWYSDYFGENTALAGQFLFEYIRGFKQIKE